MAYASYGRGAWTGAKSFWYLALGQPASVGCNGNLQAPHGPRGSWQPRCRRRKMFVQQFDRSQLLAASQGGNDNLAQPGVRSFLFARRPITTHSAELVP